MQNQHELIEGYRDLTQEEIDLMNEVKLKANEVGALCDRLWAIHKVNPTGTDPRWLSIAQTELQKGFMSMVRAIARPQSF